MKKHFSVFNTINFKLLFQIRNYRGKYLTTYQKKISSGKNDSQTLNFNYEPINFVANLSIKDTTNEVNPLDFTIKHSDQNLVNVTKQYLHSDSEYRKLLFYGSENKNISSSQFKCHGCGSTLNCESINNPGYIPYEIYEKHCNDETFMKSIECMRCFYLFNNMDPFDLSVDLDIYEEIIMKQIQQFKHGIIFILADLSELPFTIPSNLSIYKMSNFRLILLGNKSDLLHNPNKYESHYKECLIQAAEQRGIERSRIEFVDIISAKDCNKMEALVDKILKFDFNKNEPIFLIGSTNSGKSSLFNRFLKSDLCFTAAKSNIQSACVSSLPGTTLNCLKFPIAIFSSKKHERRQEAKRLLASGKIKSSTKYPLLESCKLRKRMTREQLFDELDTYSYDDNISSNSYDEKSMLKEFGDKITFDESKITSNKWFYDTPGLINPDQIISYLQKDDVDKLYRNENISQPSIFIMKEGLSFILQNLARIDILEVNKYVYLTVHARLPVEIVDTYDIDRYFAENDHFTIYSFKKNLPGPLLNRILSVTPDYDAENSLTPDMVPVDMEIETSGLYTSSADVVLSSIGWIGISGFENSVCKLRVWTPAAIGCCKRQPALMPNAVTRRVRRRTYSREFIVN